VTAEACAYFLRVVWEGACLLAASKRETALLVVPINSATASCVRGSYPKSNGKGKETLHPGVLCVIFKEFASPEQIKHSMKTFTNKAVERCLMARQKEKR
jgi:hypothetical protein